MHTTVAVSGGLWKGNGLDDCLGEREVMENGVTRFILKDKGGKLELWSDWWEERRVWMSQASSVFHQHGICLNDDLSQFELIVPYLYLTGQLSRSETPCQQRHKKSIYLFVGPLSPSIPTESCTTSLLHYFSFDPTGQHPLPPEICKDLGLPIELDLAVYPAYQFCWKNKAYKWMHQYQLARGFNPKTSNFARHLRVPICQVQSDSDPFKDIDVTMTSPVQFSPAVPSTYLNNLIHPSAATTASPVQSSPTAVTPLVTTETSLHEVSYSCPEGQLEETAVPVSQSIVHFSTAQPRTISKKANRTSPKKISTSLLGNRRDVDGKAVKDEEGTSGKCEPPQTTQDRPVKEGLKGRETVPRQIASRGNVHSRPLPKPTSPSPDLRTSPRTARNAASRLYTNSTPSGSISPPKRPQIQPREPTRVHRTVTRDATKPGMTSGKATPGSLQTRTPLPSKPIHIASSSPRLQTPRSDAVTPASSRSAKPSSSVAHISRPRAESSPALNAGTPAHQSRNSSGMQGDEQTKAPFKGARQRRDPSIPTPTRPTNIHKRSSSSSKRVWK
ncbi:hypothetical protein V5O48_008155 [Marasmius crinis-equi]|uniref:Uncharacterized protein n=1 Tax=Marasmius crinis-equi TaxID=585013 RepID=A0ABR3FEW0_9AGAR